MTLTEEQRFNLYPKRQKKNLHNFCPFWVYPVKYLFILVFFFVVESGVGFGGPSYHVGSREGLDVLGPGLNYRERSGSEGDGEDSPPTHHRPHPLHLNPQQHTHHSLRRARSRPAPPPVAHYQTPGILLPERGGASQALLQSENPYQQPYLGASGRGGGLSTNGGGLSDSPTSGNASDATLTDPELPFALPQLQNGEFGFDFYTLLRVVAGCLGPWAKPRNITTMHLQYAKNI